MNKGSLPVLEQANLTLNLQKNIEQVKQDSQLPFCKFRIQIHESKYTNRYGYMQ